MPFNVAVISEIYISLNIVAIFGQYVCLTRHEPFVAFYLYCKITLHGIKYTYYYILTAQRYFHVPFWFLKLCIHRPRGLFETVIGVAKKVQKEMHDNTMQYHVVDGLLRCR